MTGEFTMFATFLCVHHVSKNVPHYLLNNSVKNKPFPMIFGTQNPEEI